MCRHPVPWRAMWSRGRAVLQPTKDVLDHLGPEISRTSDVDRTPALEHWVWPEKKGASVVVRLPDLPGHGSNPCQAGQALTLLGRETLLRDPPVEGRLGDKRVLETRVPGGQELGEAVKRRQWKASLDPLNDAHGGQGRPAGALGPGPPN